MSYFDTSNDVILHIRYSSHKMHRTKSAFSIDFSQLEHVEATSPSDGSGTIWIAVACRLVSLLDLTSRI